MIMDPPHKATEVFRQGCNCTQSILSAYRKQDGPGLSTLMAIGSGFGSGYGGSNGACGAVSGAVMVLGMHFSDPANEASLRQLVYDKTRQFTDEFKTKFGSIQCNELIGHDLGTQQGRDSAKEQGLYSSKCESFIRGSCKILDHLLL